MLPRQGPKNSRFQRIIERLMREFDELLEQVVEELTPAQAKRIAKKREKLRKTRELMPGPTCEIWPSN